MADEELLNIFNYTIDGDGSDEDREFVQQALRAVLAALPEGPAPTAVEDLLKEALRPLNLTTSYTRVLEHPKEQPEEVDTGWFRIDLRTENASYHNGKLGFTYVSLEGEASSLEEAYQTFRRGVRRLAEKP